MSDQRHVRVKPLPAEGPRSSAINWVPPQNIKTERDALEELKNEWKRNPANKPNYGGTGGREVLILDLDAYEFYGSPDSRRKNEFQSLHTQNPEVTQISVNGFLSFRNTRTYIQCVRVFSYSIEGYDSANDESITVFVQSEQAKEDRTYDIWYRLTNKPTIDYRRFHEAFVWIANLCKHFIDYLGAHSDINVGLLSFKSQFYRWLKTRYKKGPHFHAWYRQFGRSDFRGQVNAYIGYMYSQAYNLSDSATLLQHTVWADCMVGDRLSIQRQPMNCDTTITTPFVYNCFKDMYFGYCLEVMTPDQNVQKEMENRKRLLGFPFDLSLQPSTTPTRSQAPTIVRIGDVVGIPPDPDKSRGTSDTWLLYVKKITPVGHNVQQLNGIWLCHPSDTILKQTAYPIAKEYFLSDICNDGDAPILSTEVLRTYTVEWFAKDLNTTKDILVRQKWIKQENSFVTLKQSDLTCDCDKPPTTEGYRPGDTVYLKTRSRHRNILEPVVIAEAHAGNMVTVRRLRRLERDCLSLVDNTRKGGISKNELVWTDEFEQVNITRLNRKCHILFLPKDTVLSGQIPTPYDRRGNGDLWFFSTKLINRDGKNTRLNFLDKAPKDLFQGPDPNSEPSFKKLIGLSIFSGSGNLDRGLEEGGAVNFHFAVDFSAEAIHTQRANARHPEKLNLYCGSVDDYLKAALAGKRHKLIARIGEVLFIAGGSPCPGFSLLQMDPFGEKSCRNASHITSICSYVDVYRPQYAVFENVVNMSATRKGYEDQNVLAHVVACFLAMGYQVHFSIIDAWSFTSSQGRERLCIAIAAPGLEPFNHPWHTNSHPKEINGRSLGKQHDGVSFGDREEHDTPFNFTTAGEAAAHLPDIGTGSVQACIPFPDHRLAAPMSSKDRVIARHIPIRPPGQGYAEAIKQDLIPYTARKQMSEVGRSFRRIRKDGLFPTITTKMNVQNSRASGVMHWEQPRPIAILEARNAQGYPEHEVIIGTPTQQLIQIGNAVDRNPALALGLVLRWAWEKSNTQGQREALRFTKQDLPVARRQVVTVEIPRRRQTVPQLLPKEYNGTSIKPVKEGTAQAFFRIFWGGEAKEPKPLNPSTSTSAPQSRPPMGPKDNSFSSRPSLSANKKSQLVIPPSFESTPQETPSSHRKDNTNVNQRPLSSDEEHHLGVTQSPEGTPPPIRAKRPRDNIFLDGRAVSASEESAPRKKARCSDPQLEYQSMEERTSIQQKEIGNETRYSVYNKTTEITIRTQRSMCEKQTEVMNSDKWLPSIEQRNSENVYEIVDLTRDEDKTILEKEELRSVAQKHMINAEGSPLSTLSTDSRRRTRQSGHQVEFTPTNWNKKPESMLRKRAD